MNQININEFESKFERCIGISKRVRWEIEKDVIQNRSFKKNEKFLPDNLSLLGDVSFLSAEEKVFLSQIQGRTYANMFALVERFINAKIIELSSDHALTDQTALEALIRFSDEELKHQELFARVDALCADVMPDGYMFNFDPNGVAEIVLSKSSWAVLLLTLHIELFTQSHYRESIDGDMTASELYRDVFKYHWIEESQHAIIDELELRRIHERLSLDEIDDGVDQFIDLVCAVDSILNGQAKSDAQYFSEQNERKVSSEEKEAVYEILLRAYRWQYIFSGAQHPHFQKVMRDLLTVTKQNRIASALEMLS